MQERSATRMTRQRATLLRELRRMQTHPTADELHHHLRDYLPKISLATVYRNLELLTQQGEIRTIDLPGVPRRYDGETHPHFHLRCVQCDKLVDIEEGVLPDVSSLFLKTGRYEVFSVRYELEGRCEDCRRADEIR